MDNVGQHRARISFQKENLDVKTATITRQICLLTSLLVYTIIELSNSRRYLKWQVDAKKLLQKIMKN